MLPIPNMPVETTALPRTLFDAYSHLAWRAMLTEVNLSPKPGLVDRLNCGAHKDMSLTDFHRSALAIQAWLPRFIEYGACSAKMPADAVLTGLRPLGMACEGDMFRATAGVNTHKGSIFFSRSAVCRHWPTTSTAAAHHPGNDLYHRRPLLPRPDRARTAQQQPTTHGRPATLSATGVNRRTWRSRSGISVSHPPCASALSRPVSRGTRSRAGAAGHLTPADCAQRRYQRGLARRCGRTALDTAAGKRIVTTRGHPNPRRSRSSASVRQPLH